MNDHIFTALILSLLVGLAFGVLGGEMWRKISALIKAWRFRHKVLDVYTPPTKKKEK
ncbi:hypothetical protein PALB_20210 [Pseudoalteromonas luteoviolacea B = ATCC 29581]|nr:hypothetical protein PALB_20210 [Pseudoalteromonas luteoviolacea B = ATCC 29581]